MAKRLLFCAATLWAAAMAHDHHTGDESNIPEGETVSAEPLGTVMWIHIFIQLFAYGVVFPIGMVFGLTKSRWHVPTQIFGAVLAVVGFFLGHAHTGREFTSDNVHASFASILQLLLGTQFFLGLYLKGHWEKGINVWMRRLIRPCHSILGKAIPILSWTQLLFGGVTALGFCQGDYLGQCAAHFIMGSAFVAYGILLTIILLVGQVWLRRSGRSQEFYDSAVLAAWGCVNTFTEHHWGTEWVRNDWQHTTIGIIWWCAGVVGIWLSRDKEGNPKRNFVPGAVLFITGWTMSAHPQELMVSTATHSAFGFALMTEGVARIVEIVFILGDEQTFSSDGRSWNSFQVVPIFCLYVAGFLLMGATSEQMTLIDASSMDHVSYILVLLSVACIVFLFANVLVHLYDRLAIAQPDYVDGQAARNGRARASERFELHGLMSDYEDDVDGIRRMLRMKGSVQSFESSSSSSSTGGNHNRPNA